MAAINELKPEVDLFAMVFFFLSRWKTIAAGTILMTGLGIVYALMSKPVYESMATISTRDNQAGGGASIFSQLGGLGGAVATQFGMMNTNLDKMEVILKGRELAQRVIEEHDLLPRLYPESWNAGAKKWKNPEGRAPNLRRAVEGLRGGGIKVQADARKKLLRLTGTAPDSTLAADIVSFYLVALNAKLQDDTRKDSEINRIYLEKQLYATQDPLLRERINNMIAGEIEKSMLVSAKAFDILEKPAVPMARIRPKRAQIAIVSMILGIIFSCIFVVLQNSLMERKGKG